MKSIEERKALFESWGQTVNIADGLLWIKMQNHKSQVCFILDISYENGSLVGKTHIERMIGFPLSDLAGFTVAWDYKNKGVLYNKV